MKGIYENEEEDFDVQERAGFYYSMLKNDMAGLTSTFDELRYDNTLD